MTQHIETRQWTPLPERAHFVVACQMDEGLVHNIVGLHHDLDGQRSVFTGVDRHGVFHDVPMLDDAAAVFANRHQALRVAVAVIADQKAGVEPCCC